MTEIKYTPEEVQYYQDKAVQRLEQITKELKATTPKAFNDNHALLDTFIRQYNNTGASPRPEGSTPLVGLFTGPRSAPEPLIITPEHEPVTPELAKEYKNLWGSCQTTGFASEIRTLLSRITASRSRYQYVFRQTAVPWQVVAAIHAVESSCSFQGHLHNGDPLIARTRQAPAGRPTVGHPPFTWEESAMDTVKFSKLTTWGNWSIEGTLYRLEKYNSWAYQENKVPSPYLWSGTNHYTKGDVVEGVYDPEAVSKKLGVVVILKALNYLPLS